MWSTWRRCRRVKWNYIFDSSEWRHNICSVLVPIFHIMAWVSCWDCSGRSKKCVFHCHCGRRSRKLPNRRPKHDRVGDPMNRQVRPFVCCEVKRGRIQFRRHFSYERSRKMIFVGNDNANTSLWYQSRSYIHFSFGSVQPTHLSSRLTMKFR